MASLKHEVIRLSYKVKGIDSDKKRLTLYKQLEIENCDLYVSKRSSAIFEKINQDGLKDGKVNVFAVRVLQEGER